jgi:hypothetical protein
MTAEGWYVDPYGVHDARWFSDGTPTALVRDGQVEAHDPPPDTPYSGDLRELDEDAATDGQDLLRSGDAESGPFDPDAMEDSVWSEFGESAGAD